MQFSAYMCFLLHFRMVSSMTLMVLLLFGGIFAFFSMCVDECTHNQNLRITKKDELLGSS